MNEKMKNNYNLIRVDQDKILAGAMVFLKTTLIFLNYILFHIK